MMLRISGLCLGLLLSTSAAAIEFTQPLTVVSAKDGVFHHLESSGRRAIAINNGKVAITWEDNSTGSPQIYVAFKHDESSNFTRPVQVSKSGPAYEPVIAALGDGFVIGWEAEEHVWLRHVTTQKQGEAIRLTDKVARQLSLNQTPGQEVVAVWGEQHGRYFHIAHGRITEANRKLKVQLAGLVDKTNDRTEQLFPSVVITQAGTLAGWEDRREGATRIVTAFAPTGKAFMRYKILNEFVPSPRPEFGRGTGAMRVVLSSDLKQAVTAIWMDKRDFEGGYDVYAAVSSDGGRTFDKNELVQDALGQNTPQWHATVAMNAYGDIIAAWDDPRDGNPDVWYSKRMTSGWSDDEVWPGGAGEGAQTVPVLLLDGKTLHATWLVRNKAGSAIRYISAELD
jgi:hypothetical protein